MNRIHFLLFFVILTLITCQQVREIKVTSAFQEETITDASPQTVFMLSCSNFNTNYLQVDIDPSLGSSDDFEIFVGKQSNLNKLGDNNLMRSGINEQYVYIPRSLFTTSNDATIYILVSSSGYSNVSYKIQFYYENEIEIKVGQDYSLISSDDNRDHYFKFNKPSDEGNQIVNFYAIGGHDGDIDDNEGMAVSVVNADGTETSVPNHRLENIFYGGDLIVVDENVSQL